LKAGKRELRATREEIGAEARWRLFTAFDQVGRSERGGNGPGQRSL
jgi:hypothetical protein